MSLLERHPGQHRRHLDRQRSPGRLGRRRLSRRGPGPAPSRPTPGGEAAPSGSGRHNDRSAPEGVAAAAVFLASDESSFCAGMELSVDGGMAQV
ncbi:SDR family oxidoreductase [Streptomyces mirabilis]|uniref:SDR family oxidoreductase n=1 Tax=Streptomyces TaxID=1883 RepID=UPI0029CA7B54|nr:SDR family oxidoreductase [Streptomyces sp. AK02-04a]